MEIPITVNGIIFVVLLVIPGLILKRFYFQGEFTKQFGGGTFADRLISSIFLGLLVQMLSLIILSQHPKFTFDLLTTPVAAFFENLEKKKIVVVTSEQINYILIYVFANVALSIILGTVAHKIVRILKLDLTFRVLRFNNEWSYYFRGDILHSKAAEPRIKGKVSSTYIDIVMDVEYQGQKKIVSGFLADYSISSKTGDLDLIFLTEAKRYSHPLQESDSSPLPITQKKGMTEIPGNCLIIPYSKVIDMNLRYSFKETDPTKRKELLNTIIGVVALIGVLIISIYPWWLSLSFIRTLLGILFTLITWIFVLAFISSLLIPKENIEQEDLAETQGETKETGNEEESPPKKGTKMTLGAFLVLFLVITGFIYISALIFGISIEKYIQSIFFKIMSILR